jgi:hypothetical protein
MEVHHPPNRARYVKQSATSAAGQIEYLSSSPAAGFQKLNFRVAD